MDGMEIDTSTKEGKLFKAIADILDDFALQLEDLEDQVDEITEAVDEIDEDLGELEKDIYECECDCDDEDDDDFDDEADDVSLISLPPYTGDDESIFTDDKTIFDEFLDVNDDEDAEIDEDEELYEVVCPSCNDSIYLNEKMLAEGSINCPACGELLEFDLSEEADD
jgi:rubrerythrin